MTQSICVWYWFIFLPDLCPFLILLCWTINWWLCKQNITWLMRSMCKRKAEAVQSDTVGYYHRSKLCCLGIYKKLSIYHDSLSFFFFPGEVGTPPPMNMKTYLTTLLQNLRKYKYMQWEKKSMSNIYSERTKCELVILPTDLVRTRTRANTI